MQVQPVNYGVDSSYYQQQAAYPQAQPGYDVAPGGPLTAIDYYQQQQQQQQQQQPAQPVNYDSGYSQSYYPVEQAGYSNVPVDYPSQSFDPVCENQNYIPGLPPGAKIVAEYFLGYLDEPAAQQYQTQYQQQYQQQYQPAQQSSSESSKEDVDIEVWEKQGNTNSNSHSSHKRREKQV